MSVAWPTGVQPLVFFCSSVPVVLFDPPGISRCRSQHVVSVESFGFEGRMLDLIVSVPDHCLSFYILLRVHKQKL